MFILCEGQLSVLFCRSTVHCLSPSVPIHLLEVSVVASYIQHIEINLDEIYVCVQELSSMR